YRLSLMSIPISIAFPLVLGWLILATSLAPPRAAWLVTNRIARWIGDTSYGVYAIHFVVLAFLKVQVFAVGRGGTLEFAKWQARAASGIPVIPALDGFRGVAILMVVAWHCWSFSGNESSSAVGRLMAGLVPNGIVVLFILSGFVIFLPTAARGRFGSVCAFAL